MAPEAKEAIRIADKHLAGKSPERRLALAKDIIEAISRHAGNVAAECLAEAVSKAAN